MNNVCSVCKGVSEGNKDIIVKCNFCGKKGFEKDMDFAGAFTYICNECYAKMKEEQNYSIESALCACFLNYLYEEGFCDLCKSECYKDGEPCNNNQFIVFADIPHIGKISFLCDKKYWDNFKIPAYARSGINKNELDMFNSYKLILKFCESRFSYVSMMKIHDLDK